MKNSFHPVSWTLEGTIDVTSCCRLGQKAFLYAVPHPVGGDVSCVSAVGACLATRLTTTRAAWSASVKGVNDKATSTTAVARPSMNDETVHVETTLEVVM